MAIGLLFIGLLGLWWGTELTIRGAVSIANRLGMSEFIVGVAVVSVGSDLPELTIAISGAIQNLASADAASDIIIGSAIGSGLGQIGLVMGVAGLLGYLTLPRQVIYRHGSILIGALLILGLSGLDGSVSRTEGASLVVFYVIYFIFLLTERARSTSAAGTETTTSSFVAWASLLVGLVIVGTSANWTVDAVTDIATALNIEAALISVIVIGVGTSLPELSISVAAVMKQKTALSVGNLIGSNVFDTLVPIGVASTISAMRFDTVLLRGDLVCLLGLSVLTLVFFARKRGLQKHEAVVILAAYCAYVAVRVSHI